MRRRPLGLSLVVTSLLALAHASAHAQSAATTPKAAPATPAAPAAAGPSTPAAAAPTPAQALQAVQARRAAWNKPTAPFHMIGNIYYVGTDGLASYLITTPKGHFLLDAGLPESAQQIEKNIQTLGFKLTDIKLLLSSHAHFDHTGGLARLKAASGGQVISSEGDKSAIEGGFYLGSENEHSLDSVPVKVDRTVKDGESLSLGDTKLTANLTPGHTRGCTSWSMPVQEAGKTYNLLFFCSITVAANRLFGPPQYEGIVNDYETTFAKAKTMKVDVFLAPHVEFFGMKDKQAKLGKSPLNPFINPNEFAAFMAKMESDYRGQLAQQKAASQTVASSPTPPAAPTAPKPIGAPTSPPPTTASAKAKPAH